MTVPVPARLAAVIPEFGPLLPALVAAATATSPFDPDLAPARLALATTLMESAALARSALASGDVAAARAALARAKWEGAWDAARSAAAAAIITAARLRLQHAAATARMSARRTAQQLPPASAAPETALRIGVGASVLFAQLDRLDVASGALETGAGSISVWVEEVERTARRVDESWRQLENAAASETMRWASDARIVAAWKPSPWILRSGMAFVVALCLIAGLMLGGWIAVPALLRPIADRLWGLP